MIQIDIGLLSNRPLALLIVEFGKFWFLSISCEIKFMQRSIICNFEKSYALKLLVITNFKLKCLFCSKNLENKIE